jgi:hypothetical protein
VRFRSCEWKTVLLLLRAATPVRSGAQAGPAGLADVADYWHTSLLPLQDSDGAPSRVSDWKGPGDAGVLAPRGEPTVDECWQQSALYSSAQ